MTKSPAFQFYPNDFLADPNTLVMTAEEIGAYCLLMCVCWNSPLPNDLSELAAYARVPLERFEPMWDRRLKKCFEYVQKTDSFVHPRLEKELKKQREFRKKKQDAGIESGRRRREYKKIADEQVFNSVGTEGEQNGTLHTSSSSSSSEEKKATKVASPPRADVAEVFAYWQHVFDRHRYSLTTTRRTKILSRLKDGFTVEQLKQVIDTVSKDPFYCGENDRGKEFLDFKTIFKSKDKIEEFLYGKNKVPAPRMVVVPLPTQLNDFRNVKLPGMKHGGFDGITVEKRKVGN